MSALGKRRPSEGEYPGAVRYNTTIGSTEMWVNGSGWVTYSPATTTTYTNSTSSTPIISPPPATLPYAVDSFKSMMQSMDEEQLDDIIDAAIEELRLRGRKAIE